VSARSSWDEACPGGPVRRDLATWRPVRFTARRVAIILREPPPGDASGTFAEIPLGG